MDHVFFIVEVPQCLEDTFHDPGALEFRHLCTLSVVFK